MVSSYGFKAVRSHLIQPWSQDADRSPELTSARSLHVQANTCAHTVQGLASGLISQEIGSENVASTGQGTSEAAHMMSGCVLVTAWSRCMP